MHQCEVGYRLQVGDHDGGPEHEDCLRALVSERSEGCLEVCVTTNDWNLEPGG